jgi:hypothetical protein
MEQYSLIHCPAKKTDRECGHMLAGVSIDTLNNYDYKIPFTDIRYCGNCNTFIKIYIAEKGGSVEMSIVNGEIDFLPIELIANGISFEGEKKR